MPTNTATLTDEQITHRLEVLGAQWQVASEQRRAVLHVVCDELLDERAARAAASVS